MTIENCIFVGNHAGENVIDADGLTIIGDNVRDVPDGVQIAIGKTVRGRKINTPKVLSWLAQRELGGLDNQQVSDFLE